MNTSSVPTQHSNVNTPRPNNFTSSPFPKKSAEERLAIDLEIYLKIPMQLRRAKGINSGQKELLAYLRYRCQITGYCLRRKAVKDATTNFKWARDTVVRYVRTLILTKRMLEITDIHGRKLLIADSKMSKMTDVFDSLQAEICEEAKYQAVLVNAISAQNKTVDGTLDAEDDMLNDSNLSFAGTGKIFADSSETFTDSGQNLTGVHGNPMTPFPSENERELNLESNLNETKNPEMNKRLTAAYAPPEQESIYHQVASEDQSFGETNAEIKPHRFDANEQSGQSREASDSLTPPAETHLRDIPPAAPSVDHEEAVVINSRTTWRELTLGEVDYPAFPGDEDAPELSDDFDDCDENLNDAEEPTPGDAEAPAPNDEDTLVDPRQTPPPTRLAAPAYPDAVQDAADKLDIDPCDLLPIFTGVCRGRDEVLALAVATMLGTKQRYLPAFLIMVAKEHVHKDAQWLLRRANGLTTAACTALLVAFEEALEAKKQALNPPISPLGGFHTDGDQMQGAGGLMNSLMDHVFKRSTRADALDQLELPKTAREWEALEEEMSQMRDAFNAASDQIKNEADGAGRALADTKAEAGSPEWEQWRRLGVLNAFATLTPRKTHENFSEDLSEYHSADSDEYTNKELSDDSYVP